MGKSRKRSSKRHDTGYPYAPIRISNIQVVRPNRRRSEDNGIMLVHPVFKTTGSRPASNQQKQQLKRLQFVASYAEYWWGKVCDVYMAGRQLTPGNLSPSINFMEDKFVAMTLPFFAAVQQQSYETLRQMDAKVDAFLTAPAIEQQLEGTSSKTWSHHDDQGKALYLQHETEVLASMISAAWARLVSLPAVDKMLESAQPSVEFTRKKYADAHDALVSSATYSKAMEAAEAIVDNFKHSFVYRTAAARLYPVVSSFTDPALDCIVQSQYYSAVVDHLRPTSPPACIQASQ